MRSAVIGLRLWGIAELPFCPARERLLGLAHLGALQVAQLGGEPVERARPPRPSPHTSWAWRSRATTWVATGSPSMPSSRSTSRLERRVEHRVGADGAGELAHRGAADRVGEPLLVAAALHRVAGELEAEGGGLGVDAVGAAHAEGAGVAQGQLAQGRRERGLLAQQQVAGARGSPAPGRCRGRRTRSGRSGSSARPGPTRSATSVRKATTSWSVVVSSSWVRSTVKPAPRLDVGEVLRRDHAARGPRAADRQLHLEPAGELGLLGPERGHRRARVPRDHARPPRPAAMSRRIWRPSKVTSSAAA